MYPIFIHRVGRNSLLHEFKYTVVVNLRLPATGNAEFTRLYNNIATFFLGSPGQVGPAFLLIRIAQPAVYIKNETAGPVDALLRQQHLELYAVTLKLVSVRCGDIGNTACGMYIARDGGRAIIAAAIIPTPSASQKICSIKSLRTFPDTLRTIDHDSSTCDRIRTCTRVTERRVCASLSDQADPIAVIFAP